MVQVVHDVDDRLTGQVPAEDLPDDVRSLRIRDQPLPGLRAVDDLDRHVAISDLAFHGSITPTAEQPYGSLMVEYRFMTWQGIDWFAGPGVAMLQEDGGIYSLGAVGELRLEFNAGNNPLFFMVGAGYIWRECTEEMPDPANIPFYLALGARTQ